MVKIKIVNNKLTNVKKSVNIIFDLKYKKCYNIKEHETLDRAGGTR